MTTGQAASDGFPLGDAEFTFLARFLSSHTGIVLTANKREMVRGRLVKRLRALGLSKFADYCDLLDRDAGDELEHVVNAITTNITQFFREEHHFTLLAAELRQRAAQSSRLRLWSAGCSSGEEPYSIAMTALDALSTQQQRDLLVLATDIDTNMLRHAAEGIYPAATLSRLPEGFRRRFLRRGADAGTTVIADEVRSIVRFRRLNLLEAWPMRGPFDIIFCRNVTIYFDKPTQRQLVNRYADILRPGGLLFLGHSESLIGVSDRFELAGKTAYRRLPS